MVHPLALLLSILVKKRRDEEILCLVTGPTYSASSPEQLLGLHQGACLLLPQPRLPVQQYRKSHLQLQGANSAKRMRCSVSASFRYSTQRVLMTSIISFLARDILGRKLPPWFSGIACKPPLLSTWILADICVYQFVVILNQKGRMHDIISWDIATLVTSLRLASVFVAFPNFQLYNIFLIGPGFQDIVQE